jgi:uncharacterized protein (DUF2267 family)
MVDRRTRDVNAAAKAAVEPFVREIEGRVDLPPHVSAYDAAQAVLCTLTQRLSEGEARDILDALPASLRPLLQSCVQHQSTYGLEGFLRRVAAHLDVTPAEAEAITRAVFALMHERLPAKEIEDAASQLPRDLQELWRAPAAGGRA